MIFHTFESNGFGVTVIYPDVVLLVVPSTKVIPGEVVILADNAPTGTRRVIVDEKEGVMVKIVDTSETELDILLYDKILARPQSTQ